MNCKIIAVDFDGTLCENKYPQIGASNKKLIEYLRNKKTDGSGTKIILWTCRTGEHLKKAVKWCEEHHLYFDAVNENLPENVEWMGGDTRKIFANEYIDDRSCSKFKLPFVKEEGTNIKSWAEKEIEIACKNERNCSDSKDEDWDYGCACYKSALKAYESLVEDGHSGFSIGITKHILNRLIGGKPLTPIEDTCDIWKHSHSISGFHGKEVSYQCKRMSSLFKHVSADGTIKYKDTDKFCGIDINNPTASYHSRLIDMIRGDMFPITMPYFPENSPFKVYCEDLLTDKKNGDFDTVGIFYAIKPDGERVEINRFFKEGERDFVEIKANEYCIRKLESRSLDICDMYNLQIDFRHDLVDDSYSITAIKNNPIRHGYTISLGSSDLYLYNCKSENFECLEQLIFKEIILSLGLDIKPLELYYEQLKEKRNGDI